MPYSPIQAGCSVSVGASWTLQLVPFQRSASACPVLLVYPKASHTVADEQETLESLPDPASAGRGGSWTVQLVPFQLSASGTALPALLVNVPVAMHTVEDAQDTLASDEPLALVGAGGSCTLQLVPFQLSTSGTVTPEAFTKLPAALHDVEDTHEIASRDDLVAPVGAGGCCTLQLVPFQLSASGTVTPEAFTKLPAAVHAVEDLHDTPRRLLLFAPDGAGGSCRLHVPLYLSASGRMTPEAFSKFPTASHEVEDVQDTPFRPLAFDPAGAGGSWKTHELPFQTSVIATTAGGTLPLL